MQDRKLELHTKHDYANLLLSVIIPLEKLYTEEKAGLKIGMTRACYETQTISMEGFARILWGLVPFWKGRNEGADAFIEIYQKGIKAGTDKKNPEYWGDCHHVDQRFVEMAAIAIGILLTPDILWDPLGLDTKKHLANWLYQINQFESADNNWQLCAVLVNVALKKVGCQFDRERIQKGLSRIEDFYLGEGWYTDGASMQIDYHASFSIHYYLLIYSAVMEEEDTERCERYRERACRFARQFIYWFDDEGRGLAYGNSLTYRFAQVSFWCACLYAGIEPYPIGIMKGLIGRHFRYWFTQPIFDRDGILTIGYTYPNLHMAESYNGPGSPYCGLKAFLILALPDNHPFWLVSEEPLPQLENQMRVKKANFFITHRGEQVFGYPVGNYNPKAHNHANCKYSKFVYSSKYGFSVPRGNHSLNEAAPDSMLAFEIDGLIFTRRGCEEYQVLTDRIITHWSPFVGVEVETEIIPGDKGHIRIHRIYSDYECRIYDCGFAMSAERGERLKTQTEAGCASVKNQTGFCRLFSKGGMGEVIATDPNTNIMCGKTVIPAIRHEMKPGYLELKTHIEVE